MNAQVMSDTRPVLALRFDVDSIRCVEEGIPRLRRLADQHGVRFTFFVNMGRSFNWWHTARHVLRGLASRWSGVSREPEDGGREVRDAADDDPSGDAPLSLPTTRKLGWSAVLRTVARNPMLGDAYRPTFDALHADGHELGLHGGTDHAVWQRALDELGADGLERVFRPAYETFEARYGKPLGFASPGFRYNREVLTLLDREGFLYASDMGGETPFRPPVAPSDPPAAPLHDHWQVPVNVLGEANVPLIEQGLARGVPEDEIVSQMVDRITRRRFALMYGHPYVEGIRADLLGRVLDAVSDRYDVVTVAEYLRRWLTSGEGDETAFEERSLST